MIESVKLLNDHLWSFSDFISHCRPNNFIITSFSIVCVHRPVFTLTYKYNTKKKISIPYVVHYVIGVGVRKSFSLYI
jgi:hypothetical protein